MLRRICKSDKIVFIIGPTSVGKSKLGIELAQRFNGEIISADSIQVYNHLDIGSAKVSDAEKMGIPHHLVSILPPDRTDFSVKEFLAIAREKIGDLNGKLPIVVGGTFYYVESLLWQSFMSVTPPERNESDDEKLRNEDSSGRLEFVNRLVDAGESKHQILQQIDPLMANRLHPNDLRKIERSIEVWVQSGLRHSDQIVSARGESPGEDYQLFYKDCCVLWIDADKDMLDERLDKRVDNMINQGLIEEVKDLYKLIKGQPTSTGVAQSIGYKEFLPYLNFIETTEFEAHADPVNYHKKLNAVFSECVDTLKRATRRYARKQSQWIRNRVLGGPGSSILAPKLFRFDSSNLQEWDSNVLQPSVKVVEAFLKNDLEVFDPAKFKSYSSKLPQLESSKYASDNLVENWTNYECTVCNKAIHGKHEYEIHMNSRKHKQALRRQERAPIIEQYKKRKGDSAE